MYVDVPLLVVAASIAVTVNILAWTHGYHSGWKRARRAEIERQRQQRRVGEYAARRRPRRGGE